MTDVWRNVGPLKLAKLKPYSVLLLDNDITALSNEETCDNVRFLTFLVLGYDFYLSWDLSTKSWDYS